MILSKGSFSLITQLEKGRDCTLEVADEVDSVGKESEQEWALVDLNEAKKKEAAEAARKKEEKVVLQRQSLQKMGLQTQSLLAKAARLRVETEHTQQLRQQLKQSTRYLETVADGNTESFEENDGSKQNHSKLHRVGKKVLSKFIVISHSYILLILYLQESCYVLYLK